MHVTFSITSTDSVPVIEQFYSGRHCSMSISHVHPGVYSLSNRTMEGHSDSESNTAKKKKGRLHGVTLYCAHKLGSYI